MTCHSMDDQDLLLDSPRWTGHKTVTAFTVSTASSKQQPAQLPIPDVQVAQARQLCVRVLQPADVADAAAISGLAEALQVLLAARSCGF